MKYSIIIIVLALLFAVVDARRGQQNNKAIKDLFRYPTVKKGERDDDGFLADAGGFLDDISGGCVDALLVEAPACGIQDYCDQVIDVAYALGGQKKKDLIKIAQRLAKSEKNTPEAGQPSLICTKPPRYKELKGLHFAQDPTNPGNHLKPYIPQNATLNEFKLKHGSKLISPKSRKNSK